MAIFSIKGSELIPIEEKNIDLEKNIQKLTEENLKTIFGLDFVTTEFSLTNFRLDTVAYDRESNAFVIIEYKRDKSFSVIDQGYSYLALMLNNKADFILEYNQRKKENFKKQDIDWSQSRIMFLANSFTTYQQNAINFRDLPIELWEVRVFDNSTILYNQILSPDSKESVKLITKSKNFESVSNEVRVYTVEDHISKANEKIKDLFEDIREKILNLGQDVKEIPKKQYIAYKTSSNFADLIIYSGEIRITLNLKSGELNDPKNTATDFTKPKKGHWGNGDYEIVIKNDNDLIYAISLIEQSYKKSCKYV